MALTILVAEDEPIIACDLCDTVEEAGFEVEGPHSGASSALVAAQKHRPALAILDVELADGLSFDLASQLIADDVPVIFHSGSLSAREIGERFPGAITLPKPCPPTTMLAAVDRAVQRARKD